jgi:hypothetical protein
MEGVCKAGGNAVLDCDTRACEWPRLHQGTFDLSRASAVLIEGFEHGGEFVYVHIGDAPPQEQLL